MFLLHGAYGSKRYYEHETEVLVRAGYRVVAWDAPGYGTSPVPEQLSIVGMVAQKVADLHGGSIDALVLSATAHTFNHSGEAWQQNFLRTRVAPLTQGRPIAEYAPDLLRSMMGPGAASPAIDHALYCIRLMNGAGFQKAIQATSQYLEDDVPARLQMPVLCIAGELDETCPARVMQAMAKMMPRGEFHEMKGVGHFGWAEREDEYHDVLGAFLKQHLA